MRFIKTEENTMLKKYTLMVVVSLFLLGCGQEKTKQETLIADKCISAQSQCHAEGEFGQFTITFDTEKPIAEQPFYMYVRYQGDKQLSKLEAYMEGKNMYMGKVPLFFETDDTNKSSAQKAMVLLGSCSEDKMLWQINFIATFNEGTKTKQKLFMIELISTQY